MKMLETVQVRDNHFVLISNIENSMRTVWEQLMNIYKLCLKIWSEEDDQIGQNREINKLPLITIEHRSVFELFLHV